MRQLLLVTPDILDIVWPKIEHILRENAWAWRKMFNEEELKEWIRDEKLQLWCTNDEREFHGAMLTCLVAYPRIKYICVLWVNMTGMNETMKYLDCVEMWGHKNGANEIMVLSERKGWARALELRGYKPDYSTLSKDISHLKEC